MRRAAPIATVRCAVGPRGRARGLSRSPSSWCHPAAALPRGTQPAVSGLLERKYDAQFKVVFDAIRALMAPPEKARRSIGFNVEEARPL